MRVSNIEGGNGDATIDGRPVVVGEVLFDHFPDGSRVLGGAPFNVAWHLQAFGLRPLVVTRIGGDPEGRRVLEAMDAWGMDTSGVQVDAEAPTGRVSVRLDGGVPHFDIVDDQAYDHLDATTALAAIADLAPALLYHGTLVARSAAGRSALRSVRELTRAPVFLDVNLRDPWWQSADVAALVDGARWVKLNEPELARLADSAIGDGRPELAAAELARRHGIEQLVVTCGDRGAFVWADGRSVAGRPPRSIEVIDTVGAGDAFSAAWIVGLWRGWSLETTLIRALDFAEATCGLRGATGSDRRIYEQQHAAWGKP